MNRAPQSAAPQLRPQSARAQPQLATDATAPARIVQRLTADRDGERLDVFIARSVPDCSRATAQRLIDGGHALVDGAPAKAGLRLRAGMSVTVAPPPLVPSTLTPEPMALSVVYEDADLLVIDKPAGLVVHPGAGHAEHTLVHGLLAHCTDLSGIGGEQRPGIVHRLDRDTSGLLIVAKHDRAHAALSRQLQARTISKYYLALVRGAPGPADGVIDAPIGRAPRERQRMAITDSGRPARTRYHTIALVADHTLLLAGLETGRTHQLRVHFAALGCPIAGDPLYGRPGGPAGRLWLHAWRLAFTLPGDGRRIALEAPLPADLAATLPADSARILARARRRAVDSATYTPASEEAAE